MYRIHVEDWLRKMPPMEAGTGCLWKANKGRISGSTKRNDRMKTTGSNLGNSYYSTEGFNTMMEFLSSELHKQMIANLLRDEQPLSLLVDGSNDRNDRHILSVSFVTLSRNKPVTYLYRLLDVSNDQSAEGLLTSIMTAFEEDNLQHHIKSHLYGYSSDGASVMMNQRNSLDNLLRNELDKREIYSVWCYAHRLQLITSHGLRENEIVGTTVKSFESIVNGLYSFYSGSTKRNDHLSKTALSLNERKPSILYIYIVRWIESEVRAIDGIINGWKVIVKDLEEQLKDSKGEMSRKIQQFLSDLKDRDLLLRMLYIRDILSEFRKHSKKFQQFESSLIDILPMKEELRRFYDNVRTNKDNVLTRAKDIIETFNCNDHKCRDAAEAISANSLEWNGIQLDKSGGYSSVPLDEFILAVIDSLNSQTFKYFPHDEYGELDIFDPTRLPLIHNEIATFGVQSVSTLAVKLSFTDITTVLDEWKQLLESLANHPIMCEHRNNLPHIFWTQVLNIAGNDRFPRILQIIRIVLALPSGTSTVERSFSYMNHIESPTRSSLSLGHLQDRMRIAINGPTDLRLVRFGRLTNIWLQSKDSTERNIFRKEQEAESDHRPLFL